MSGKALELATVVGVGSLLSVNARFSTTIPEIDWSLESPSKPARELHAVITETWVGETTIEGRTGRTHKFCSVIEHRGMTKIKSQHRPPRWVVFQDTSEVYREIS